MSFWSKKKPGDSGPPPSDRPGPARIPSPPPPPDELTLLHRLATPSPPSTPDALTALRRLRATPDEARALELLLHLATERPLAEPLAVAAAGALVDRGEPGAALTLLAHAASSPALMMTADLRAERGDYAVALALVERVLLRDLEHPGARERHRRLRAALGLEAEPGRPDAGSATVVTREPDAPFVLLREVARGGAGAVYEAEDRDLGRRVALKVYHHPDRDRAQLTHEARVAASLAGPGIVHILDIDPEHGWIALEWAALGALRDHVRAKNSAVLAPIERWAVPLATAIARVHAAGWVHHDIKPANVLLGAPERPVLADFGIARRAHEPAPANLGGSLGYVSPERLAGRASDPRDDVFGFGRILEDVLESLGHPSNLVERWRPLALACVASDDARPADGRALLTRIRVESA